MKNIHGNFGLVIYFHVPYVYTLDNILTRFNSVEIEDKQNNCTGLEGMILSLINKRPMSIDAIKSMVGLTDEKIEELLFEMEIRGDIKQSGGVFTQ